MAFNQVSERSSTLILKPLSNFRQIKTQDRDGMFRIEKETFNTESDLKKILEKRKPLNTYASTGLWLKPTRLRGKKKSSYQYADRILLDHDVVVDIDVIGLNGLEEVKKVLEFFKERPRYCLQEIYGLVGSGGGFHVCYEDTIKPNIAHPLERLEWYKKERTALKEELLAAGIHFDTDILTDIFRVTRVIGTENWNSRKADGSPTICRQLHSEDIYNPPAWLLETVVRKPKKETTGRQAKPYYPTIIHFIDNKVPGIKDRYVPILIWHKETFKKHRKQLLRKAKKLKLGKLLFSDHGQTVQALGFKTISASRLGKVLQKMRSLNYLAWQKYKHCWIHVGKRIITENSEDIKSLTEGLLKKLKVRTVAKLYGLEKPAILKTVEVSPSTYFASKPHIEAISSLFPIDENYPLMHGTGTLKENLVLRERQSDY